MGRDLRTDIPHAARIYDYVLGGKDNYEVDRVAAEGMLAAGPQLRPWMRANRRFMARVARHLAERGFRQFLDIGTGLPTHPNLHEVVQEAAPDADIVYLDNDPIVLAHARALLTPVPGSTGQLGYLDADLRDTSTIFDSAPVNALDLTKPVAVTMIAVMQLIDDDAARRVIDEIMGRLTPGSALAISAVCDADDPDGVAQIVAAGNERGVPIRARSRTGIQRLFGNDLVLDGTGVVGVHRWRPGEEDLAIAKDPAGMYGGLAFKVG